MKMVNQTTFLTRDIPTQVKRMQTLMREAAAAEVLPAFRGSRITGVESKTSLLGDLVTDADRNAGIYILDRIRPDFPGSYSEEHKFRDRFGGHRWLWQLDPVDGTYEFCMGKENGFAMHAALLEQQAFGAYLPVAGIIYLPMRDKMWVHDGATLTWSVDGEERPVPEPRRNAIIGHVRELEENPKAEEFYHKLGKVHGLPVRIVHGGGSGSSFSDLMDGTVNVVLKNMDDSKEWDIAMAVPMIGHLGGFIRDMRGKRFTYNRKDVDGEPYNRAGYIASVAFSAEEILPHLCIEDVLVAKVRAKA